MRGEVFGLLLDANRFVWFADHTSPNATDDSMTGFTYMDSRTGAMTYYTSAGGEFNSVAAERSVSANPIITQGRLIPTQPILYNIGGRTRGSCRPSRPTASSRPSRSCKRPAATSWWGTRPRPHPSPTRSRSTGPSSAAAPQNAGAETTLAGTIDRFIATGTRILFTIRGRREIFTIADPSDAGRAARAQRRQRAF